MGAVAMNPDIRVVYDGLDQDDRTVDSPPPHVASDIRVVHDDGTVDLPPSHVALEAEQNDELQPTDQ